MTDRAQRGKALARPYCSATAKQEIRRAIGLIHRQDNYDAGMELLCKLAGIKFRRVRTQIATMAELQASSQNAEVSDGPANNQKTNDSEREEDKGRCAPASWSKTPPTGPGYFWSRSHGGQPVIAWHTDTGMRMACDQTLIVLDSAEGHDWMDTQCVEFWPEPIVFDCKKTLY